MRLRLFLVLAGAALLASAGWGGEDIVEPVGESDSWV